MLWHTENFTAKARAVSTPWHNTCTQHHPSTAQAAAVIPLSSFGLWDVGTRIHSVQFHCVLGQQVLVHNCQHGFLSWWQRAGGPQPTAFFITTTHATTHRNHKTDQLHLWVSYTHSAVFPKDFYCKALRETAALRVTGPGPGSQRSPWTTGICQGLGEPAWWPGSGDPTWRQQHQSSHCPSAMATPVTHRCVLRIQTHPSGSSSLPSRQEQLANIYPALALATNQAWSCQEKGLPGAHPALNSAPTCCWLGSRHCEQRRDGAVGKELCKAEPSGAQH